MLVLDRLLNNKQNASDVMSWSTYAQVRKKYFGENVQEALKSYDSYRESKINSMIIDDLFVECETTLVPLPKCEPCKPALPWKKPCKNYEKQKEGNTPMAYNTVTPTAETDAQVQRKYLKDRLRDVRYTIRETLTEMFNIYESQNPKSYKDLIDWIKNDKFTLDAKRTKQIDGLIEVGGWYGSFLEGINWTGSGKPADHDGYSAAEKELDKAYIAAMDIIVTGDPSAGLAALQKFETFVPSNAPKTVN